MRGKLSREITEKEFDSGYWYATDIKEFAREIGITGYSKLRKDEIETSIKHFLRTGKLKQSARRLAPKNAPRDVDKPLSLARPIIGYTSNKTTKDFIVREALRINPNLKEKSGARYRLNRWREEQIQKGKRTTYGDLVKQYIVLNESGQKFEKIPSGRYINFLSEFLSKQKGSTRAQAIAAWHKLKKMNIEKNYTAWLRSAKK